MANPGHVARLKAGVQEWNTWRESNPIHLGLSGADISQADLRGANLEWVDLSGADLSGANLTGANLRDTDLSGANVKETNLSTASLIDTNLNEADLRGAELSEANLTWANLNGADLSCSILSRIDLGEASLTGANLSGAIVTRGFLDKADLSRANLRLADLTFSHLIKARLREANLTNALLHGADLRDADLTGADLSGADLSRTDLSQALLSRANLTGANLSRAVLISTDLRRTNLTGCLVYGISAWDLQLEGAVQSNLVITPEGASPRITTDDLEIAQFIYLLLNNKKIRHVIDTITSKVVLILGRFTPERKPILDALRDELRKRDYLPVMFDFEKPSSKTTLETVSTLAHMARFVIADITDAKSVLQELQAVVPLNPSVPVQPLILNSHTEPGMFDFFRMYPWVLEAYLYEDQDRLLAAITDKVICPAEAKAKEQTRG